VYVVIHVGEFCVVGVVVALCVWKMSSEEQGASSIYEWHCKDGSLAN
jgi:hypothetical protein